MINVLINFTICFSIIVLHANNCFALEKDEVINFIYNARKYFLAKDIINIENGLSDNFKYIANTNVNNETFKDNLSKLDYLKYSEIVFKSDGIFNEYNIDIEEVKISGNKANIKSSFISSFSLDGITQNCKGDAELEIISTNRKLTYQKIVIEAKCNNQ